MDKRNFFATVTLAPVAVSFHDNEADALAHAEANEAIFVTQESDLADLTKAQLTDIHNATIPEGSNIQPVESFRKKEQALSAAFANLAESAPGAEPEEPAQEKSGDAEPKARKLSRGINLAPKATIRPCRAGTKQAIILDLISRPQGATMDELRIALSEGKPWQDVTIKSGLSWDMNSVKGYGIRTTIRGEGDNAVHAYHAVFPEGVTGPLAHTPRAADRKAAEAEAAAKAKAEAQAAQEPAPEAEAQPDAA